jgi:hypothetical protein
MKTSQMLKSITLCSALALAIACSDENRLTIADREDISEDAISDSYFEDADDLGSVSLSSASEAQLNGSSNNRERDTTLVVVSDTRRCVGSAGITVQLVRLEDSTPTTPRGILVVDFGTGCTDIKGNTRKGKLIFEYTGRRFQPGSTVVMTTDNYSINDVQLEGTRTVTNTSESTETSPKFTVVLAGGKATFPDGKVATREATITREWIGRSTPGDLTDDELRVTGSASGETRNERSYTMTIEETLVFERDCAFRLPLAGVKTFVTDGKTITINYGEGECDRSVTYTVGERTITTQVGNN